MIEPEMIEEDKEITVPGMSKQAGLIALTAPLYYPRVMHMSCRQLGSRARLQGPESLPARFTPEGITIQRWTRSWWKWTVSASIVLAILASSAIAISKEEKNLPPHYRQWLSRDVVYIISKEEKDAFLRLVTDQDRDTFIDRFWESRNPTPGSPQNSYKDEIYKRIAYANQYFGHESGTEGWRSSMGRVYITLGEPKQKGMYLGYNKLRPMQMWFYENANPALPPFFYIIFYIPDSGGDYRIYSPYIDGPEKLVNTEPGSRTDSLKVIQQQAGDEVARTVLSLIPDEPVDFSTARASLQSDVMLATIHDLANHPLTKKDIARRRELLETVSHRVILGPEFLDALMVPLRDSSGNTVVHYVLREQKPEDFVLGQEADGRHYYSIDVTARVLGPEGKTIFTQQRAHNQYVDSNKFDDIRNKSFAYEGLLPLPPGKYKLEFVLTDRLNHTGFRTEKDVVVPDLPANGVRVTDLVPFSASTEIGAGDFLPFGVAGIHFDPMVGPQLDLVAGENLQIVYQIWAAPGDPRSFRGKTLQVEYGYGRPAVRGDSRSIQDEVSREQFDAHGSLVTGKRIPTADLNPGNYHLSVTITDPETQQKAFSSMSFRIETSRNLPATWYLVDPDIHDSVSRGEWDYERAMCYWAAGDKISAERWFRAALQKDISNQDALAKLVELYFGQNAFAKIAELYVRVPFNEKTEEQTILRVAESLDKTGNVKQAISALESALTTKQNSGPIYLMLSSCYQEVGNQQKAQELERKGKSLMATTPPAS
jgi:GWxTD domain-containing protein